MEEKITSSDLFTPDNLQQSNITLSTPPEKEVPTETPIPTANTEDDIPDWLKGADAPIVDAKKEIEEESTEATT